jgi:poly(3-hydroxybutyrate) depolymerase
MGAASAGCGLSQGQPQNFAVNSTILTYPDGYDGSTPVPLVFGFHGAGRTNLEQQTVDSQTLGSELEQNYVMAFVKSAGNAWDLGTDYPRFQAIRTQILAQLCIDTDSVFAFGHSSGAQFIVQMLGDNRARETGFAAVAPVSSSNYGNPDWSPVPTLLIHGENDTQRGGDANGAQDIRQYAQSNQCSDTTTQLNSPACNSITGRGPVDPGCVQYNGCAAPTLFCRHDDPNYIDNGNVTNHGWPCFANRQIFEFFEAQR